MVYDGPVIPRKPTDGDCIAVSHANRLALLALLALLSLATGCAVNPVTGKSELSLISPEQEIAIGAQQYQPSQQSQGGRYYIDPELQNYVAGVGRKLAAVSDRAGLPYEFVVLNNPVPNAWALPGGKIAINTGLLLHLEDESQLAAVLAHEIVHAAARHGASQMSRGVLVNVGTQVAGVAAQSAGYGNLGGIAAQLGGQAWMARYGRDDELESDAYGMDYMKRAGYDPLGAVELQETFVKLNASRQQDFLSGLFASHPPSQERVNRNREKAAQLGAGGLRNRDVYQRRIAQLKRDKPAYDAQTEAIKALNNKDGKTAISHLDRAIKLQPRDGAFWELRGHAWSMLDEKARAEQDFSAAISRNPAYFSHHLARGVLRYESGRVREAMPDLEKSHQLLPTTTSAFYLGQNADAGGDRAKAIGYYQQAAQSSGALGKKAQSRLVHLEMAETPHKYISSTPYLGDDGRLWLVIRNNSALAVTGVQVQLGEMVNSFMMGNVTTLPGPSQLGPGQQAVVKTRIAIAERGELAKYRTQVVAARPAN